MKSLLIPSLLLLSATAADAQQMHFSFDNEAVTEDVSQKTFRVEGMRTLPYMPGIAGSALRLDGYSNYIAAQGLSLQALNQTALTLSMWCAAESYPMMTAEAENVPTYTVLAGNLDDNAKTGFAFLLSSQGGIQFKCYLKSWPLTCDAKDVKLPKYTWNNLVATLDQASNKIYLYLNGVQVGTAKCPYELSVGTASFMIGKSREALMGNGYHLNTFNGLVDEIKAENGVKSADMLLAEYNTMAASAAKPDLTVPASAWEDNIWRPQFHGMPSHGWTNECHGMTYSDGRYHLFFQKNGNGPYMSRLHWGHISSPDLCAWTEEPIAIAPSEAYDIKGCWSGCVFTDNDYTGGTPYILYTAVDNAKATICQATPADATLRDWSKNNDNPLINGRPGGLSDDFRDPYFFTAGGKKYIIVGTSKDGRGACTLHEYRNGGWTNDGSIFFQAESAAQQGRFWEMPTVTPMGGGLYLFTCTPLDTSLGVRTLCWVGTIGEDGKFTPTTDVQYLEMGGISKDGYGLLSPTIFQKDGKTILLGIVPDKLPTAVNLQMGWAHNYSLPRELHLSADGKLIQQPYSGLEAMRSTPSTSLSQVVNGAVDLGLSGRHIELKGEFVVGDGKCGLSFLKGTDGKASLSYDPSTGSVTLDLTKLPRQINDDTYGGIYNATLPQRLAKGETLRMHVYLDGSIADIFVGDTWAFSVRIFPASAEYTGTEVFAESETQAVVNAWTLHADGASAIGSVPSDMQSSTGVSGCFDISGRSLSAIPSHGIYIVDGKKHTNKK